MKRIIERLIRVKISDGEYDAFMVGLALGAVSWGIFANFLRWLLWL